MSSTLTGSERKPRRLPRFSLRSLILFVLLAGSGYGLWVRWEPWVDLGLTDGDEPPLGIATSRNAELVRSPDGIRTMFHPRLYGGPDRDRAQAALVSIDDAATGEHLAELVGREIWSTNISSEAAWFSQDGYRVHLVYEDGLVQTWYRRRPEQWWGIAWLPEFWLTVVLSGALLFSLRRDSRIMRA